MSRNGRVVDRKLHSEDNLELLCYACPDESKATFPDSVHFMCSLYPQVAIKVQIQYLVTLFFSTIHAL